MNGWAPAAVVREGRPGEGLRVAVAGAAHWHLPRHAAHLREAGVTFCGVADRDAAIAARWARELDCPALPDAAAIIETARPDLVLALGRVADMAAQATVLLEAGLPLLAEKPLGRSAAEVEPLAALAAARRSWVAVALVQRYDPLWSLLDDLRDTGRLGSVTHLHVRIINGPPQRYVAWGAGWMLDPSTAGGGALLNLGIHGIDYVRHLVGPDEPVRVCGAAVSRRTHRLPIEEFGAALLASGSGMIGTIEAGYTYPDSAAGMTRSGDNEVRLGAAQAYIVARGAEVRVTTPAGEEAHPHLRAGDRYRDWIFDSLARLRTGAPPAAGMDDCLAALRLLDRAYDLAGEPRER